MSVKINIDYGDPEKSVKINQVNIHHIITVFLVGVRNNFTKKAVIADGPPEETPALTTCEWEDVFQVRDSVIRHLERADKKKFPEIHELAKCLKEIWVMNASFTT